MTSKQIEKTEFKKLNSDCKYRHFKLNAPPSNKVYCNDCEAWVEKAKRNSCDCCSHKLQVKKYDWIKELLKEGKKQNGEEIERYQTWIESAVLVKNFKDKQKFIDNQVIKIRKKTGIGTMVYEIPIRYLILYDISTTDIPSILAKCYSKIVLLGVEY